MQITIDLLSLVIGLIFGCGLMGLIMAVVYFDDNSRDLRRNTMKDDTVSRAAVMQSLTREYNRRRTGDGLKLAWIEKAVDEVPSEPLTVNGVTLYPCDPEKNTPCSKTNCFMNGGECRLTTYKEYREEHHGSD